MNGRVWPCGHFHQFGSWLDLSDFWKKILKKNGLGGLCIKHFSFASYLFPLFLNYLMKGVVGSRGYFSKMGGGWKVVPNSLIFQTSIHFRKIEGKIRTPKYALRFSIVATYEWNLQVTKPLLLLFFQKTLCLCKLKWPGQWIGLNVDL